MGEGNAEGALKQGPEPTRSAGKQGKVRPDLKWQGQVGAGQWMEQEPGVVSEPVWQEDGIWGVVDGNTGKVDRVQITKGLEGYAERGKIGFSQKVAGSHGSF